MQEDELVMLSKWQLCDLIHLHCCKVCHQEQKEKFDTYVDAYWHSCQEDSTKIMPKTENEVTEKLSPKQENLVQQPIQ